MSQMDLEKLQAATERQRERMLDLADQCASKAAECVEAFKPLADFIPTRELRETRTVIHKRIKCEYCQRETDYVIDVTDVES